MANSPAKQTPHPISSASPFASASTTHLLGSPRSNRPLRKLQSANALSTHYAASNNTPSLISQQRQQQQRNINASQTAGQSQIPPGASHQRTRSNSDAIVPSFSPVGAAPLKRNAAPKKAAVTLDPKDELEALIRQGPRGDLSVGLQRLRHLILCDGLDSDSDGMVRRSLLLWRWSRKM